MIGSHACICQRSVDVGLCCSVRLIAVALAKLIIVTRQCFPTSVDYVDQRLFCTPEEKDVP